MTRLFKNYIAKNNNVLKLWRARNLPLEGKITVFKSLAPSEITNLVLVKTIPPIHNRSIKQNTEEFYLEQIKPYNQKLDY